MTMAAIVQRVCAVCAAPLTGRQERCCSQHCVRVLGRQCGCGRDQRGEKNANFKGWRSRRPVVYTRRFKAANPEKVRAHQIVSSAIRNGLLVRPAFCESCLQAKRIDAHHEDYSQPLVVRWLCRKCHIARDRARAAERVLAAVAASEATESRRPRRVLRLPDPVAVDPVSVAASRPCVQDTDPLGSAKGQAR